MGGTSSYLITDPNDLKDEVFDYIVVGGGTAGCVIGMDSHCWLVPMHSDLPPDHSPPTIRRWEA